MTSGVQPPAANLVDIDKRLVQIVDASLRQAAEKSGAWLACRPGCWQCCVGTFAINQLDRARLESGMAELVSRDPQRARRVRERSAASVARLAPDFPGDPLTGLLGEDESNLERFEHFANEEICPALDRASGTCDVYEARPMTCRVFGPPVRSEDGLGVCELCYQGATAEEIAGCEMIPDPDDLEFALNRSAETAVGTDGRTIVAFALGLRRS